jgi:hypothetical protein
VNDARDVYNLLVSFPDQSETFVLGVEAGIFRQRLEAGERVFQSLAHAANVECLRRMAEAKNCALIDVGFPIESTGWTTVSVHPAPTKPKLAVVR